ncbi:hypothetical protein F4780DRAFT_128711 [Xylariomycetidae sp. FL0641]|nr:hypothetical protein F4780DRAFT_128711 [Xylariomycetidae sp. FL0641]
MVLFEDNAPNLAAGVITICIIGYVTYGLRVYCRLRFATWGVEDWCMTAALPFFTILSAACIAAAFTGIGATNETLDKPGNEEYSVTSLFWFFLFEVFYCLNIIPVKVSISLMLIRIAQNRKSFILIQWVVIGMFSLMNLIAGLYIIFQCSPVSAAWTNVGHCNDPQILTDVYYATTAVNIVTDWITAFMPIPLLWNVQMNRNAKISVAFVLGLGFFASLSACIRLKYTVNLLDADNYHYAVSDIVLWGYAENGLGLAVGCMSTLKPLFRKVLRLSDAGSSDPTSKYANPQSGKNSAFPGGNSRRTYTDIENNGYELSNASTKGGDKFATNVTAHDRDSLSDTESQKKILGANGQNGIYVSRQVAITRE